MSKCPVIHFEMPARNNARAKKFYEEAFGWEMNQMGEQMGSYLLATTTESDDKGPKNPGAINGGFFTRKEEADHGHVVISVPDIEKHIEIVKKAGGKIVGEVMDIPGIGKFVMFGDSEGNPVGMLQPTE